MESSQAQIDNQIYLESNELNKLMETLMIQITTNKPQDIVSHSLSYNFRLVSSRTIWNSNSATTEWHVNSRFNLIVIEADRRQYDFLKTEVQRLEHLLTVFDNL